MFGLVVLNKPPGMTSRDAVNRVQRIIRPVKVGHAGTLDPIASGVLVLCLGPATRLIEHVQQMPKRYLATFRLGVTSPSDDIELEPTPVPDAHVPSAEEIAATLPRFQGTIQQVPPAYSAIKIQGEKAYDRVRRGEQVEMKPRPVTIYGIDIVRYEHPQLVLDIRCGSGTYIRSLGRDLALTLGTGAVMTHLVRSAIGDFTLDTALEPNEVTPEKLSLHLRPAVQAVPDLPQRRMDAEELTRLYRGMPITGCTPSAPLTAAIDPEGNLAGLLKPKEGQLWPLRVFARG